MGVHILEVTFRLGNLCDLPVKQAMIGSNSDQGRAQDTLRQGEEVLRKKVYCPLAWVQAYSHPYLQLQKSQETKDFQPCVPIGKQPQKGPRH